MNKDTLVSIGAGKHQKALLQTASAEGLRTVAVDRNLSAHSFGYAEKAIVVNAHDAEAVFEQLDRQIDLRRVKGVMTQAARGCITTVAYVAERLGLRQLRLEVAELAIDKEETSRRFNDKNYLGTYSGKPPENIKLTYPCVLKVSGASGSLGTYCLNGEEDLRELSGVSIADEVIIERYIKGRHFAILGLCCDHQLKIYGIMEKELNADLTIYQTIFPAEISLEECEHLYKFLRDTLDQFNFDFGPFELELILSNTGNIVFVELEPSVVGSYISEYMIPVTSGNSMIRDAVRLVCFGEFNVGLNSCHQTCVQRYYYPSRSGEIVDHGIRISTPTVQFYPYLTQGSVVEHSRLYISNGLALGKTKYDAEQRLDRFDVDCDVSAKAEQV